ncbi:MAG: hypothetical protein II007_11800 [Gammaproteobacteria bacterium]|nr:hypothetical protein [Gammaproteobacteria bacterium]
MSSLLMACSTSDRVIASARGDASYLAVDEVPLEVTAASRDGRYLYVCLLATNPDGWSHAYTIRSTATGEGLAASDADLMPVVKVERLFSGCHREGAVVPVLTVDREADAQLAGGLEDGLFVVDSDGQWGLIYLSTLMTVSHHDRYAIDLSGSAIYRQYVNGRPYMWLLVPVATALDAAAVMTMGMVAIACSDELCEQALDGALEPLTRGQ